LQGLAKALRELKNSPALLVLHLPPGAVLHKSLSFPSAARQDLRNLLQFEIERETPFTLDEIYWTHAVSREDTVRDRFEVDLYIAPRQTVDTLLRPLHRAGLKPTALEIDNTMNALLIPLRSDHAPARAQRRLVPAAAAITALLALAAPFAYQQWAISSADSAIAGLKAEALEAISLRRSADRRAQTDAFLQNGQSAYPLQAMAAVTRSLPADTYLTSLALHNSRLTLMGLSPSAAQLVGLLAHSPLFRQPSLDAPIVKNGSGNLERFTISVSLAQGAVR
jgi:general secretion pathway protein L